MLVRSVLQIFIATPDDHHGYAVTPQPLAWASPGRVLGAKFDANGDLLIANAPLGLLQLASPGDTQQQRLLLLTGRVSDESPLSAGYPIEFANSLDVAEDGTVYFSSSTDVVPYRCVRDQALPHTCESVDPGRHAAFGCCTVGVLCGVCVTR
jgi:hypothetical protein